ncbi:MAG: glycosyltransferase [Bacilli bacterium]|nr:glycosyltransferase [Bacilli bacterium]
MRVALFTDTYLPEINGVATSTNNLAKMLEKHGHDVLIVTTNPFNDRIEMTDNVLRLPGKEYVYGYRMTKFYSKEAMKYVEDFGPEIVHIQSDIGVGVFGSFVAAKFKIGAIYTYHTMIEDYTYYVTKGHFERAARNIVRLFYRGKSVLYDEIISPSEKSKDYLRFVGVDRTISVIPTGIELTRFSKENEDKGLTAQLKSRYGIAEDETVILSLGRIAEEKSIDVLIRGYAKFLKTHPSSKTKLVITGWGPAEDSLKLLAEELGLKKDVIFTGKVDQDKTQNFYHLGDIFVSASLSETQGLTFIEAMAAENLVLARFDDNLVGTIIDGVTGKFFFDEDDFAVKLEEMLGFSNEEKRKMKEAALKNLESYSLEKFYERVMEVYNRVRKKYW